MSLYLLLQQCSACLVCLIRMVCEMGGRWPFNCCFGGCYFQDLFKTASSILMLFPSRFFSEYFVSIHGVHSHNSIDTAWKKSHFILLDRSDFQMTDYLLIAFYAFHRCMLTSLSVDEMLLPRYVNWST